MKYKRRKYNINHRYDYKNYPISNWYADRGWKPPYYLDHDRDGIVDSEDCNPYNPYAQGWLSKIGRGIRNIFRRPSGDATVTVTPEQTIRTPSGTYNIDSGGRTDFTGVQDTETGEVTPFKPSSSRSSGSSGGGRRSSGGGFTSDSSLGTSSGSNIASSSFITNVINPSKPMNLKDIAKKYKKDSYDDQQRMSMDLKELPIPGIKRNVMGREFTGFYKDIPTYSEPYYYEQGEFLGTKYQKKRPLSKEPTIITAPDGYYFISEDGEETNSIQIPSEYEQFINFEKTENQKGRISEDQRSRSKKWGLKMTPEEIEKSPLGYVNKAFDKAAQGLLWVGEKVGSKLPLQQDTWLTKKKYTKEQATVPVATALKFGFFNIAMKTAAAKKGNATAKAKTVKTNKEIVKKVAKDIEKIIKESKTREETHRNIIKYMKIYKETAKSSGASDEIIRNNLREMFKFSQERGLFKITAGYEPPRIPKEIEIDLDISSMYTEIPPSLENLPVIPATQSLTSIRPEFRQYAETETIFEKVKPEGIIKQSDLLNLGILSGTKTGTKERSESGVKNRIKLTTKNIQDLYNEQLSKTIQRQTQKYRTKQLQKYKYPWKGQYYRPHKPYKSPDLFLFPWFKLKKGKKKSYKKKETSDFKLIRQQDPYLRITGKAKYSIDMNKLLRERYGTAYA